MSEGSTVAWRTLLGLAEDRLAGAGISSSLASEARRIVEQASGWDGAELTLHLDDPSTLLTARSFSAMLERRLSGEPLQYVLGRWGFRTLDLYLDRRVLIPRPETEQVVEAALGELRRLGGDRPLIAVDLGTGSGAIALALAAEHGSVEVWATDESEEALAVTGANLAGLGGPGARVRLAAGSWFEALPPHLRRGVDLIVSNPPYVAASEVPGLPAEVADWEPLGALVPGPNGLEAIELVVTGAVDWLASPGALVVEHAPHQAATVCDLAHQAGFVDVETRRDLAGRDRMLVART